MTQWHNTWDEFSNWCGWDTVTDKGYGVPSEEVSRIKQELIAELHRIADQCLSKVQYQIWVRRAAGLTTKQIADDLDKSEATVYQGLYGNYTKEKRQGGIVTKMRIHACQSTRVLQLLVDLKAAYQAQQGEQDE